MTKNKQAICMVQRFMKVLWCWVMRQLRISVVSKERSMTARLRARKSRLEAPYRLLNREAFLARCRHVCERLCLRQIQNRRSRLHWKLDDKSRPVANRAMNGDRSAVLLHNPIGNGKADASSAKLAASRLVYTVKTLEDSCLIFLRNSNSRVTHRNNRIAILRFQAKFDGPWRRCVLDGVVEQNGQQSLQGLSVRQDRRLAIRERLLELKIAGLHQLMPF